jgi:hypothetical protein
MGDSKKITDRICFHTNSGVRVAVIAVGLQQRWQGLQEQRWCGCSNSGREEDPKGRSTVLITALGS